MTDAKSKFDRCKVKSLGERNGLSVVVGTEQIETNRTNRWIQPISDVQLAVELTLCHSTGIDSASFQGIDFALFPVGNVTGNPWVTQPYPYPYPWKPVPVDTGMGRVWVYLWVSHLKSI